MPAGTADPYYAIAIGARSQPARTYLEGHLSEFLFSQNIDDLYLHSIKALAASMPSETPLTASVISLAIVGVNEPFHILSDSEVSEQFSKYIASSSSVQPSETSMDI